MSVSTQLPIEEGGSKEEQNQSPQLNSTTRRTQKQHHPKRRKRRGSTFIFTSQTKFIVVLLSLLYIGEKSINPNLSNPPKGQFPGLGTLFVLGASADDNDPDKHKKKRMPNVNVNAAPDIPIFRNKNKKKNVTDMKTFSFFGRKNKPDPKDNDAINQPTTTQEPTKSVNQLTFSEILKKAGKSGIGGGVSGAIAGVAQVLSLMWLRTVMNYQCRYGSSFIQAMRALNSQGGIPRFYRGMSFALIQAPLARFVATAANDGVETLLTSLKYTKDWGPGRSTVIASMVVGMWRILLMPIDTCKTVLQVDSVDGFRSLMRKVKAGKMYVLYQGTLSFVYSNIFNI